MSQPSSEQPMKSALPGVSVLPATPVRTLRLPTRPGGEVAEADQEPDSVASRPDPAQADRLVPEDPPGDGPDAGGSPDGWPGLAAPAGFAPVPVDPTAPWAGPVTRLEADADEPAPRRGGVFGLRRRRRDEPSSPALPADDAETPSTDLEEPEVAETAPTTVAEDDQAPDAPEPTPAGWEPPDRTAEHATPSWELSTAPAGEETAPVASTADGSPTRARQPDVDPSGTSRRDELLAELVALKAGHGDLVTALQQVRVEVASLRSRTDELVRAVGSQADAATERLNEVHAGLASQTALQAQTGTQVAALAKHATALAEHLGALRDHMVAADARNQAQLEQLGALSARLDSLDADREASDQRLAAEEENAAHNRSTLATLRSLVENLVTEQRGTLASLADRLDGVEETVESLSTSASVHDAAPAPGSFATAATTGRDDLLAGPPVLPPISSLTEAAAELTATGALGATGVLGSPSDAAGLLDETPRLA